jgi:hypothetical protein
LCNNRKCIVSGIVLMFLGKGKVAVTPAAPGAAVSNTSFSSTGNSVTASYNPVGTGTATAGLIWAGANDSSGWPTYLSHCEAFGGSTWTSKTAPSNKFSSSAGWGISTAAIAAGGTNGTTGATDSSSIFDGTSWTTLSSTPNTNYTSQAGFGISGAGLYGCGYDRDTETATSNCWLYDDVAFTSTGATPGTMSGPSGFGASNAGVFTSSYNRGTGATTYNFNGTTWSTSGNKPNSYDNSDACGGTQTGGISMLGYENQTGSSLYNGTSWSTGPSLSNQSYGQGGGGGPAFVNGGYSSAAGNTTTQKQ